jgi:hypothetical protein
MAKKLAFALLALGILIIIVAAGVFIASSHQGQCNYNDPSKSYLKKTTPCVINFLCIQGRVAFSDGCGCGCKVADANST